MFFTLFNLQTLLRLLQSSIFSLNKADQNTAFQQQNPTHTKPPQLPHLCGTGKDDKGTLARCRSSQFAFIKSSVLPAFGLGRSPHHFTISDSISIILFPLLNHENVFSSQVTYKKHSMARNQLFQNATQNTEQFHPRCTEIHFNSI